MLRSLIGNPNFHKKMLFSDETDKIVGNRSKDNLRGIVETPLHPQKVIIWFGIFLEGIIDLYFFQK